MEEWGFTEEEKMLFDQLISSTVSAFDDSPFLPFPILPLEDLSLPASDPLQKFEKKILPKNEESDSHTSDSEGTKDEFVLPPIPAFHDKGISSDPEISTDHDTSPETSTHNSPMVSRAIPWSPQNKQSINLACPNPAVISLSTSPEPSITKFSHPWKPSKKETNGDGSEYQWVCGVCQKTFRHQYTLTRHLPTHTNERNYKCDTCGKAFRQMSTLSQHKAIHSDARPHVCNICSKNFNRVSTLISHRKTHTEKKSHVCTLCGKAFHQKGNLRNHVFTHTDARPYKCNVCGKGFNQMSNLMCHKSHSHLENGQHQCNRCGAAFPRRNNLRQHEECVHGIRYPSLGRNIISACHQPTNLYTSYEDGILIDWFVTPQLIEAWRQGRTPYAQLKPHNGASVLVKLVPGSQGQHILMPVSTGEMATPDFVTHQHGKLLVKVPLVAIIHETINRWGRQFYIEQITREPTITQDPLEPGSFEKPNSSSKDGPI